MSNEEKLMRVIAGKYRHRKLYWPSDESIRPTKDRVKESIFSALGDISHITFLDLYAGSGAIGIEALSRDADISYFVDVNQNSISCIKKNLESLNISSSQYQILYMSDLDAINKLNEEHIHPDIIFMDPPYKKGKYEEVIKYILDNGFLSPNGIIVAESDHPLEIDHNLFNKVKEYHFGKEILVTILRR